MRKSLTILLALIIGILVSKAQTPPSTTGAVPRAETIKPTPPEVYFKRGIEIVAPDSLFSLNLRFRMQSRALYFSESLTDFSMSEAEARVRRLRLRMEGFMYNPKLSYLIQLSFSRGDMDWNVRDNSAINNSPNIIRDACVFYRPDNHWTFIFGQTKLPGNRQRVISSGDQQFIDRSIVNATYNIDRDFGLQAQYLNSIGNLFYIAKGALTTGDGRNVETTDKGLAYTGRLELLPLGKFKNMGDYFEGDLEREETPKISIAGGLSYNEGARRTGGQIGRDLYQQRNMTTYIYDALLKYRGFALYLEHLDRRADDPITMNEIGQIRHITTGTGSLAQASYLFKNNYEVAARYAMIRPSEAIANLTPESDIATAGVTKYIIRHKVKLQANISYQSRSQIAPISPLQNWGAGFQIELGI
ncbi:MAG: porin [Bacteroidetes bacterium]|nr:porin [Bacteroidota bacterium]